MNIFNLLIQYSNFLGDDFGAYLTKYIGNKATLALLLDYDGTLSPIAKHPDLAILPPETKKGTQISNQYRDWSTKFETGLNIMIGIAQKVKE